jgi:hypothetical protein
MSSMNRLSGKAENADTIAVPAVTPEDLAVEEALKNFRLSVHAWSDSAFSRPRALATPSALRARPGRSWRLATGWALAVTLVAAGASGGVFEHNQRLERQRMAEAARLAEQQKAIREQQAIEEEDLLANVDSDVSRDVPSAMEPLARLMNEEAK